MICYYQSISKKSLLLFFLIYLLPLIPSITVFFLLDCHQTLESPTLLSHFSHLTCKTVLNQYQLAMLLLHPLLFSLAFHKDLFSDLYFSVSTLLLFLTFFRILLFLTIFTLMILSSIFPLAVPTPLVISLFSHQH